MWLITKISILLLLLPPAVFTQTARVNNLRCENWRNPYGIDVGAPSLSWQIETEGQAFLQSAYQVIVSDKEEVINKQTGNYWNSGKIVSGTSIGIRYAGKKLQSGTTYYWRVKIWDKNNQPSAWSKTNTFTTGLYTQKDWSGAQWIGYEELPDSSIVTPGVHLTDLKPLGEKLKARSVVPYFRKEFPVTKKIASALVFISGLGQYELTINGKRVVRDFLTPGWTYYDKRVFYNVYDISDRLPEGQNVVGVLVGNGFYNINRERYIKFAVAFGLPKLICKIQIRYTDGSTSTILSDGSWKTSPSPITFSSIFGGEDYDAQLEQPGWDEPSFNDQSWKNALLVKTPKGLLESEKTHPVTVNDSFTVKTIMQPAPGIYVYDFGQNASGIVELKVKGKKGQTIKLLPAELLNDKNLANQNATGKPYYFSYTLKGTGVETWKPRFTYYGFRYVQVEGAVPDTTGAASELPVILNLASLHTGSSEPVAGTFTCSNDLFNRIHDLIRWAIKSNLQSVVTDCPHREKLSWLEQDHLMGGSIKSNFNVYHLYRKLVYDMMDAQTPEGLVPDIAPEFVFFKDNGFGFRDSPEWGSAAVIVPWLVYKWYGDKEVIRTAYPMMKKYVAYLQSRANDHIVSHGLGDWYDYGPNHPGAAQLTPKELTATAIYYYDISLLSKMAVLLNDAAEANRLTQLAAEVQTAFNRKFYNATTGIYSTGSQTAMAMPLCVGLVPEQNKKTVLQNLVDSITLTGKKLTAGDVGYHFLVQALQQGGASQLLFDMNYRDDVPGYGYQLKKGATALTESWPALKEVSNNHLMLGHIMEWFYNGLAGIDQSERSIAYKEIIIKPELVGDITSVKASWQSPYGVISSEWKKESGRFSLKAQIPANTTATIYLPALQQDEITVNGIEITKTTNTRLTGFKEGRAIIQTGSGIYTFTVRSSTVSSSDPSQLFKHPPASAKPWTFWYWMHAAVSKEGITADLEAMKEAGIGGAYLMPIQGVTNPPLYTPVTEQLSAQWWQLVKFAMTEARRLGLQIAMHASDGFALAGGPWITPELSMQKVTWSTTYSTGNKKFHDTLPQPPANENYYKDIAVLAFPSPVKTAIPVPKVTTSQPGLDASFLLKKNSTESFRCDTPCWIQYEFPEEVTIRSIVIRTNGNNFQAQRLRVSEGSDGELLLIVKEHLEPARHGWQDTDADYTYNIGPLTGRFFQFSYDKWGSEPGAEDLDAAKWKPSLKISGIELSPQPAINQYEGKNGTVWRLSRRTTQHEVPDSLCVPLNSIVDITNKLSPDGRLNWDMPPGEWTIVRIGHTSNGHTNATGGAGKGLECDKFNPEAVRLQFDKWFGEAERQAGPELAKEVLKIFHVDSWECGSQNWSPVFRAEFKKRRGYDLLPYIIAMTGIPVQSAERSEQFLYDIRQTIAELVKDNFYTTLVTLAHEKGIQLSAESVAPTMMSDGMLHYSESDIPMGEFWWRSPTHDKPNDMLDAISGGHIYGKPIIQAEAFTTLRMAWNEHPGMLKAIQDRNYALGINRLVYHVFTHNPWMDRKPGMTLDGIGLYFQRDQTWWKMGKAWVDYAQRCQALLQWGKPVTDIAVFTGEELPRRAMLPDRFINTIPGIVGREVLEREEQRQKNEGEPLRQVPDGVTHSANMADPEDWVDPLHGYAYDSFNPDALLRLMKVKNGKVELPGGANYKMLIIPGVHQLSPDERLVSPEVAARLFQLVQDGATIVLPQRLSFFNPDPVHSPGMQSWKEANKEAQTFAGWLQRDLATNPRQWKTGKGTVVAAPLFDSSFHKLGIEKDLQALDGQRKSVAGIAWTHRSDDNTDIYFISEQLNQARTIELSLRVVGKLPELWNPVTGEQLPAANWKIKNSRTLVSVHLEGNESLFIVLRKKATAPVKATGINWREYKTMDTLQGSWTVKFDTAYGGPAGPVQFNILKDWTSDATPGIRYYSGTAHYTKSFTVQKPVKAGERIWLDIGAVNNLASVIVNGVSCGIAWTAPYRVEITHALKPGTNELQIEVVNTWANRLIGDSLLPEEKRITHTTAPFRLKDKPLQPAGLLGPVVIKKSHQ